MSSQQPQLTPAGYGSGLVQPFQQLGEQIGDIAGMNAIKNTNKGGKALFIIYWVLLIIMVIYMIVMGVIYYNRFAKYSWDETKGVYVYTKDNVVYEVTGTLIEENDLVVWNVNKCIINGLMAVIMLYAIVVFIFIGPGGQKMRFNHETVYCNVAATQVGYAAFLALIWFIINVYWDAKYAQMSTSISSTTESFKRSMTESFQTIKKVIKS